KPVVEHLEKEVCVTTCKPVTECVIKDVCCTAYKEVIEQCCKEVKKTVCKPVTTCKTVSKKVGEWVCEEYCVPGRKTTCWEKIPAECCFDPCTCKTTHKPATCRKIVCQGASEVRTRKVWRTKTVCEQVPCTTYVKECVIEKIPYTVC